MAKNYSDIGLNDRLEAIDSIPARRREKPFNPVIDFNSQVDRGAVTRTKIQDLAIGSDQMAGSAVTSTKIADAAVITSKFGTASVTSAVLEDLAVTAGKLAGSAVITGKIGTGAVGSIEIQNAAIGSAQIGNTAIGSAHIQNAAIGAAAIAAAAVGSAAIGTAVISDAHIASLNANKITAGTMSANYITGGTMSFNRSTGGTLVLGGTTDVNGVFSLRDVGGTERISMTNQRMSIIGQSFTFGSAQRGAIYYTTSLGGRFYFEALNDSIWIESNKGNGTIRLYSNGVISMNIGTTGNVLRVTSDTSGTIAELDAGGNLRIKGTLTQNATF